MDVMWIYCGYNMDMIWKYLTKWQGYMAYEDDDVCLVPPRPASENAVAKPQRTGYPQYLHGLMENPKEPLG